MHYKTKKAHGFYINMPSTSYPYCLFYVIGNSAATTAYLEHKNCALIT